MNEDSSLEARIDYLLERGLCEISFAKEGVRLLFYAAPAGFEMDPNWRQYLKASNYYRTLTEAVNTIYEARRSGIKKC